jgi:hypothetical protein
VKSPSSPAFGLLGPGLHLFSAGRQREKGNTPFNSGNRAETQTFQDVMDHRHNVKMSGSNKFLFLLDLNQPGMGERSLHKFPLKNRLFVI